MSSPESFPSSQNISRERARQLDQAAAKEKQALEAARKELEPAMQELEKSPKAQENLRFMSKETPGIPKEPEDLTDLAVEEEPGAYDDIIYRKKKKAA